MSSPWLLSTSRRVGCAAASGCCRRPPPRRRIPCDLRGWSPPPPRARPRLPRGRRSSSPPASATRCPAPPQPRPASAPPPRAGPGGGAGGAAPARPGAPQPLQRASSLKSNIGSGKESELVSYCALASSGSITVPVNSINGILVFQRLKRKIH